MNLLTVSDTALSKNDVKTGPGMFSAAEMVANYSGAGAQKARYPVCKTLLLGILAGMVIALGSAAANTAVYAVGSVSMVRLISGLIFPFGLAIIVLVGAELFTGNCLITISVLNRETTPLEMLRNWMIVYSGNFAGALAVAASCAFFGQLGYSSGALAVFTIRLAASKSVLPFGSAVVSGIFCNVLVCLGVLCSSCARDVAGRILGAYLPVAFFVISGFEHSVADMYYVSAGLFALRIPAYAAKAAESGINLSGLTWSGFFTNNLLPVTIGNIIGGAALGAVLWACYMKKK